MSSYCQVIIIPSHSAAAAPSSRPAPVERETAGSSTAPPPPPAAPPAAAAGAWAGTCCRCSLPPTRGCTLPPDTLLPLIVSTLAAAVCGLLLARGLHCLAAPRQFGTRQPRTLLLHPGMSPHCHGAGHSAAAPPVVSDAGAGEGSQEPGQLWSVVQGVTTGGVALGRVPRCAATSQHRHQQPGLAQSPWLAGSQCWLVAASQSGTDCSPAQTRTVTTCSDQCDTP